MACSVLFFDTQDYEKKIIENSEEEIFEFKFFSYSLNNQTVEKLSSEDFDKTVIICVNKKSKISSSIIDKFKNLRLISTRSFDYSHINLPACLDKNIAIINLPEDETNLSQEQIINHVLTGISGYFCAEKEYRVI